MVLLRIDHFLLVGGKTIDTLIVYTIRNTNYSDTSLQRQWYRARKGGCFW